MLESESQDVNQLILPEICKMLWIFTTQSCVLYEDQGRIQTVATVAYATVRFFKDNFF